MTPMTLTEVAAVLDAVGGPWDRHVRALCVAIDSRAVQEGDLFFAIRGDRFDGHDFVVEAVSKGAIACVCDHRWYTAHHAASAPGTPRPIPCLVVPDTVEALGRLAAYYRREVVRVATVVVGITGTNGKTTTKNMIDHLLRGSLRGRAAPKSFNNKIGVPLTLLTADAADQYLLVEIGSNAPGEVDTLAKMASPSAAVITSIGEAHLEGLGGVEGVAAEKVSLLRHVRRDGLAVVNVDRPEIGLPLARAVRCRLLTVGTSSHARLRVADARGTIFGTTFELDGRFRVELKMPGLHHATNAAAAFAVARWFGVAPEEILDRFRTFRPLEGRTRLLTIGSLTVVDDAYNANPGSVSAAIETLRGETKRRRVLVLGDMLELGAGSLSYHRRMVDAVFGAGIEILIAVGSATEQAVRLHKAVRSGTEVYFPEDAEAAGETLTDVAHAGDVVWIKGSRALHLDCVVRHLEVRLGQRAAVA